MRSHAEALLKKALQLPDRDRVELAGELLHSLEPAAEMPPEAEIEAAWRQVVADRVAELDAGEVETEPWDQVRDRLLARLSERRAG
jgi:putative addiction module component (TIGR02574 family)